MPVADLLLRMGAAKQFRPLWSEEILNETERNLVAKLAIPRDKARARVSAMRHYFPDAMVTGFEALTPSMTNDPKDRHVLAAAVRSSAELIVTFNTKDFPAASTTPYDIEVRTPDDFLLDQLDLDPVAVVMVVRAILRDMRHPALTPRAYCAGLSRSGLPLFAGALEPRVPPT